MTLSHLKEKLADPSARKPLARIYGGEPGALDVQAERYARLLDAFAQRFPAATENIGLYSAPGRAEIGGNHTDHNHGLILAAAISLDTIAVAAPTADTIVKIFSEGYDTPITVDLKDVKPQSAERHHSAALVRGIAGSLKEGGHLIGGFSACVASDVAVGSGLSSSAAFEVLVGTIFNNLYNNNRLEPRQIALAGRHAENFYFGKPSGLMDQMTSALGGFVTIDFTRPQDPKVRSIEFDLARSGYVLVITNTGGSHSNLTPEYAAVQREMQSVAQALGGETLRDIKPDVFAQRIGEIRAQAGDRAVLRAMHFYADNARVADQVAALEIGDVTRFLALVRESGRSSWMLLQNCYIAGATEQPVALGLALSESVLKGVGAWRVHGGGFAGSILAVVPADLVKTYAERMERVFGAGCSTPIRVRPVGATRIRLE